MRRNVKYRLSMFLWEDRLMRVRFAMWAVVAAVALTACGTTAMVSVSRSGVHTPVVKSVTQAGSVRWNFEALLHQEFGQQMPCSTTTASGAFDFRVSDDDCTPLAEYSPYIYTFSNLGESAFHVEKGGWSSSWEIMGAPILINGHPIACNTSQSQVLAVYSDNTMFNFGCASPND
jgi:hypothetical protein